MYNQTDTINKTHAKIQSFRSGGFKYAGYPVYNITKSDLEQLSNVANKYGIPTEWLINLIQFETARTFNPSIKNNIGATGLIQFLPSTANWLGTTTDKLSKMTFKEQLKYVDLYLSRILKNYLVNGKIPSNFTQGDIFMAIFYPSAIGKPNFVFPDSVRKANAGISKPYDYTERALRNAIFPLSEVPYTLSEYKSKFGDIKKPKSNALPIIVIGLGIIGLGFYLYRTKSLKKIKL
jgi:hypothetical protein